MIIIIYYADYDVQLEPRERSDRAASLSWTHSELNEYISTYIIKLVYIYAMLYIVPTIYLNMYVYCICICNV